MSEDNKHIANLLIVNFDTKTQQWNVYLGDNHENSSVALFHAYNAFKEKSGKNKDFYEFLNLMINVIEDEKEEYAKLQQSEEENSTEVEYIEPTEEKTS
jgi:hypothetical protein